ncbi:uncharacterized protein METZ01_LOCUS322269, partial [marine metagenome]
MEKYVFHPVLVVPSDVIGTAMCATAFLSFYATSGDSLSTIQHAA